MPERRGYGKSDGQTFGEEVGKDLSQIMMRRFHEEASDVLAGPRDFLYAGNLNLAKRASIDFLRTLL